MTDNVEEQSSQEGPADDDLDTILDKSLENYEEAVEKLSTDTEESEEPKDGPDEQSPEPEPEEPSAEAPDGDGEEGPASDAEDQPGSLAAPENWSANDRETFSKMPQEAQEFLLRRHGEMDAAFVRKSEDLSDKAKHAEAVTETLRPVTETVARYGLDEMGGLRSLVSAWRRMRDDPSGFIKSVAQQANVDLQELAFGADDTPVDPQVSALQQRLDAYERERAVEQTQRRQQHQQQVQADIQAFKEATDDGGNLKHPHFDKLKEVIGGLLVTERAKDMEEAYEMAVWADPEIRSDLIEQQKKAVAEAERKKREEAMAKTREAAEAAPPDSRPSQRAASGDLDDIINSAIEAHS